MIWMYLTGKIAKKVIESQQLNRKDIDERWEVQPERS